MRVGPRCHRHTQVYEPCILKSSIDRCKLGGSGYKQVDANGNIITTNANVPGIANSHATGGDRPGTVTINNQRYMNRCVAMRGMGAAFPDEA